MLKQRPYQSEAIQTAINHCKTSTDPVVLDMSVGAGKTIVISEICKHVISLGGQCMSLAHTTELLESAIKTFGTECCVFSAGLGQKKLDKKMIYAGEQSIVKALHKLPKIDLLCIDEADRVDDYNNKSSYMKIINHVLEVNPKCRLLAFTGTPFRMKTGAIYANKRLFKSVIYQVTAGKLLSMSYLTPVITYKQSNDQYNFTDKNNYTNQYLKSVVESEHRLTKHIVDHIISNTQDRKKILVFASTLEHADEIKSYFPDGQSDILSSKLSQTERKNTLSKFHYGNVKYLINKDILTVGYDYPEIDCIAILRPTESKRLFIQIIGRGMRLHDNKDNCLLLDYAGNLDRHGNLDYLFSGANGESITPKDKSAAEMIICPECGAFCSEHDHKCGGCGYWFIFKECSECGEYCSITARHCLCGNELIDPNKPLHSLPSGTECFRAKVIKTSLSKHIKNKVCLRLDVMTDDKLNNYPNVSQFIAEGTGHLKHWVNQHIKEEIDPAPFYDSVDMILRYEHDFDLPGVVNYKKNGKYFNLIEV